jgi:hypothetical protein
METFAILGNFLCCSVGLVCQILVEL